MNYIKNLKKYIKQEEVIMASSDASIEEKEDAELVRDRYVYRLNKELGRIKKL